MIALNYAERLNVDPIMLMQKMFLVHGRPGVEAQLKIALVNACGRFTPIKWRHENEYTNKWICTAYATEKASGEELSFTLDWGTVVKEKWLSKPGSKWATMPMKMMQYRSASWWADLYCPEVVMGLPTVEEIAEAINVTPSGIEVSSTPITASEKLKALESLPPDDNPSAEPPPGLEAEMGPPPEEPHMPEPPPAEEPPAVEYNCPHCDFKASSKGGLTRHINRQHKGAPETNNGAGGGPSDKEPPAEQPQEDAGEDSSLFKDIHPSARTGVAWQRIRMILKSARGVQVWKDQIMPELAKKPITEEDDGIRVANLYSHLEQLIG